MSFCCMGKVHIRNEALLLDIAEKIKQLRMERSLTQEDVYNDTGIHIARIETGKSNITISTLHALLGYFGVALKEFF